MRLQRKYPTVPDRRTTVHAANTAVKPPLPYTPGSDGAGVVEAVGEGVKKVKPNDRVYTGRTVSGSYAEYSLALEEQVHTLPAKIEFKQGAGICGSSRCWHFPAARG
jgi:NADPH:quinone reductase